MITCLLFLDTYDAFVKSIYLSICIYYEIESLVKPWELLLLCENQMQATKTNFYGLTGLR